MKQYFYINHMLFCIVSKPKFQEAPHCSYPLALYFAVNLPNKTNIFGEREQ